MSSNKKVLLVCGGGNGAHVLAGLASRQDDVEVRVLTLYADEAQRWTDSVKANGNCFHLEAHNHEKPVELLKSRNLTISKNPNDVVPGCDVIAFVVPAFAHGQYFEAIKPHIVGPTILFSTPGASGFEFQVLGILGTKARLLTIFSFESLPWICRIQEFGKCVEIMGFKETMGGAMMVGSEANDDGSLALVQHCVGERPLLGTEGHLMGMTLGATNQYIHPAVSYGKWHNWNGKPVAEKPLFYQGVNQTGADMMSAISEEALLVAKRIMERMPSVDLSQVKHIHQWYIDTYGNEISDQSTLYSSLHTNRGYAGLTHPMKEVDGGGFVPDFTYRYYTEDIPCGLVVVRGIAQIVGVETPNIDKIILWAQEKMDKEYLVEGKLSGKDVGNTRCPQKYGMSTVEEMFGHNY